MVRKLVVRKTEPRFSFEHPVAELNELGFRCKITFTPSGTRVVFEDKSHTTSKDHWVDMDVDDFCDVFDEDPDFINEWFETVWLKFVLKLELLKNTVPNSVGGVVTKSSDIIGYLRSMNEPLMKTSDAMRDLSKSMNQMSVGLKVMRPPTNVLITNNSS